MTTLSTEEKEQFLSLKKRLKDLSKGSWLHDYCNRSHSQLKNCQSKSAGKECQIPWPNDTSAHKHAVEKI